MKGLRETINTLRWHYPEVLRYKINGEVFFWWDQHAIQKKYFFQTALYSAMLGFAIFIFALQLPLGPADFDLKLLTFLAGSEISGFILLAGIVLIPHRWNQRWLHFKEKWLDLFIYHYRFEQKYQLVWLPPFFLLSLLLFVESPGPVLSNCITVGFFMTAVIACYLHSIELTWRGFGTAFVAALFFGGFMWTKIWTEFGLSTCVFFNFILLLWILRGSDTYFEIFNRIFPDKVHFLWKLRSAWLLGFMALIAALDQHLLPEFTLGLCMWVWFLCGTLLSNIHLHYSTIYLKILAINLLATANRQYLSNLENSLLTILLIINCITAIAICLNMFSCKFKGQRFS